MQIEDIKKLEEHLKDLYNEYAKTLKQEPVLLEIDIETGELVNPPSWEELETYKDPFNKEYYSLVDEDKFNLIKSNIEDLTEIRELIVSEKQVSFRTKTGLKLTIKI